MTFDSNKWTRPEDIVPPQVWVRGACFRDEDKEEDTSSSIVTDWGDSIFARLGAHISRK